MGLIAEEMLRAQLRFTFRSGVRPPALSPPAGIRVSGRLALPRPSTLLGHVDVGYAMDAVHHLNTAQDNAFLPGQAQEELGREAVIHEQLHLTLGEVIEV